MSSGPVTVWEERFRAPAMTLPTWPKGSADRFAVNSNETGTWQLYAWDRATGVRRLATEEKVGVTEGTLTADGSGVVWFHEETGDEFGRWLRRSRTDGPRGSLSEGRCSRWRWGTEAGSRRTRRPGTPRPAF